MPHRAGRARCAPFESVRLDPPEWGVYIGAPRTYALPMTKPLTHSQFENLRSYPESPTTSTVWRAGGFHRSLIDRGYLRQNGDRVTMTDEGRAALTAYRERYGIRA